MSARNIWSECQESSKKIAQNNSEFIKCSGERIQSAISNSTHLVSDAISEMNSTFSEEGPYTTMSRQSQSAHPVMQKVLSATRENIDTTLGIAEDATRTAEVNLIEVGRLANGIIEEDSQYMPSPHSDAWRASAKQMLSSWVDASNWFLQASRNSIEVMRSAFVAPIPGTVATVSTHSSCGSSSGGSKTNRK